MIKPVALLIAVHVAAWLLFFSLIVSFIGTSAETADILNIISSSHFLLFAAIFLLLFYLHAYYFIPSLYFKKKYTLYIFVMLLLFAAVWYVQPFDKVFNLQSTQAQLQPPPPPPSYSMPPHLPQPRERQGMQWPSGPPPPNKGRTHTDIISIILFVMICCISWGIQIIKKWRNGEERAAKAEAEKAQAELAFLKAQINPHFLFNTLNNIYSLALSKSDNAAPSIMKLSKIMHYVTDEVSEDFVILQNELDFIDDYIQLQRLRLNSKVSLEFSINGNVAGKRIAPLILMPFIENVFKYGISNHEASDIVIQLSVTENKLYFLCQNKIFGNGKKDERTGIGIKNTRQRLEHLYLNKHSLQISTINDLYKVELSLDL